MMIFQELLTPYGSRTGVALAAQGGINHVGVIDNGGGILRARSLVGREARVKRAPSPSTRKGYPDSRSTVGGAPGVR